MNETKVQLRALERIDLQQLRDWRNLPEIRKRTREYRLLSMENQNEWFEGLTNDRNKVMFGIEAVTHAEHVLIGVCGLAYINWKNRNAEVSIYIGDEGSRGHGYGKDSLELLLAYGFNELGLHRIWAEIYSNNNLSHALFRKCGFKEDGLLRHTLWRDGRWWDSRIMSILSDEFKRREKRIQ